MPGVERPLLRLFGGVSTGVEVIPALIGLVRGERVALDVQEIGVHVSSRQCSHAGVLVSRLSTRPGWDGRVRATMSAV